MGASLDPDSISRLTAIEPTEAHKKGEQRMQPSRNVLSPYDEGLWCLSIKKSNDLKGSINNLLATFREGVSELEGIC